MNCSLRLRPALDIKTPLTPDEVIQRLREALPAHASALSCSISDHYVVLRINDSRRHFGSPQLTFDVQAVDRGSELHGLFMPMPSIWTAFMGLYALIIFAGFSAACYGYAQLELDHRPTALFGVPIALVLLVAVHLAACVGQHKGSDQIEELRRFVDGALH